MGLAPQRKLPDHDTLDDDGLVRLARKGDEQAVRVLVQRHNQLLFRLARSVVRDPHEAEDVVQAAYVRAFTNLDGFRGEARLSTWLSRIVLNESYDRVRRRKTKADVSEIDTASARGGGDLIMFPTSPVPSSPEAELGRDQVREILEQATDALPEIFRTVFVMRDIEGLSIEETAALLSIKPGTVKTRLHRARRMMRRSIEDRLSPAFSELFPFGGARCARMADRVVEGIRPR